jgi:hypothetical protein
MAAAGAASSATSPAPPSGSSVFAAAAFAKFLACVTTYPHEVLRTRLREQHSSEYAPIVTTFLSICTLTELQLLTLAWFAGTTEASSTAQRLSYVKRVFVVCTAGSAHISFVWCPTAPSCFLCTRRLLTAAFGAATTKKFSHCGCSCSLLRSMPQLLVRMSFALQTRVGSGFGSMPSLFDARAASWNVHLSMVSLKRSTLLAIPLSATARCSILIRLLSCTIWRFLGICAFALKKVNKKAEVSKRFLHTFATHILSVLEAPK